MSIQHYNFTSAKNNDYFGTRTNLLPIPNEPSSSGSAYVVVILTQLESQGDFNPVEQIKFLKDELGFNISEIAEILLATRPSIYNWLNGDKPMLKHQERLDEVYNLLNEWKKTSLGPIAYLSRRKLNNNSSLFSLLCSDAINYGEIKEYLSAIESQIKEAEHRKVKRKSIQGAHDYQKIDENEAQKALDRITKKIG